MYRVCVFNTLSGQVVMSRMLLSSDQYVRVLARLIGDTPVHVQVHVVRY